LVTSLNFVLPEAVGLQHRLQTKQNGLLPIATVVMELFPKRRDRLWVLRKRLERGAFSRRKPGQTESTKLNLSSKALAMLTDGVELTDSVATPLTYSSRIGGNVLGIALHAFEVLRGYCRARIVQRRGLGLRDPPRGFSLQSGYCRRRSCL
jgi:hypothetical protein